jgi:GT2 family glycosyltransferase
MIILRRTAFEAVGGYREVYGAAHEDWELTLRLALAGFRVDVIPEYLHLYRMGASSLSQTTDPNAARGRLLEAYESHLRANRLGGLAELVWAYYNDSLHRAWALGTETEGELQTPLLLRPLQALYRQAIPLGLRLRLHQKVLMPLSGLVRRP